MFLVEQTIPMIVTAIFDTATTAMTFITGNLFFAIPLGLGILLAVVGVIKKLRA
jgi:uncharacterized integral membrane protein